MQARVQVGLEILGELGSTRTSRQDRAQFHEEGEICLQVPLPIPSEAQQKETREPRPKWMALEHPPLAGSIPAKIVRECPDINLESGRRFINMGCVPLQPIFTPLSGGKASAPSINECKSN